MIHPKKMAKIRIISHSRNIRPVVESLYELKLLHIIDFKKGEGFDIGKPLSEATRYSQELIDLRTAISRLAVKGEPRHVKNIRKAEKRFSALSKEFKNVVTKLDALKAEEARLAEAAANPLAELGITKDKIKDYKALASFVGTVKAPIEEKLASITKDYMLVQKTLEKQTAFALLVPQGLAEKAREILNSTGFSEGHLPEMGKSEIASKLAKAAKEIAGLQHALNNFAKSNAQFLIDYEYALTQLNEKAEAPLRFAASRSAFVAAGWVPADTVGKLQQAISPKEKIAVEILTGDDPPTVLQNPKPADSFEFLLNLYSLPRHYEIDPTLLMMFTFPLFFGFMLGDVGYGFITLALMLLLERKMPAAKPLIRIIIIASLASILFGFVFGEAFGYEFWHPLLNRVHDINTMILLSVAIGVVHVNAGFVLGFINELHHHGAVNAFLRKISWIALQAGVAIAVFTEFKIIGAAAVVASVAMIIKGEGVLRIVELPGLLSNILSYIRLYAIGLSSVSLAAVVNNLASGMFAQGIVGIIGGVLILLAGHAVNLLLGMLGPFLHSVRLHYVEFFQKFYEGGGYVYNPFGFVRNRR